VPSVPAEAAGDPAAALLAAQEDGRSVRGERAAQPGQRWVAGDVEDEVVAASAVGEVLAGVVDDVVGSQGPDQVCLAGAAHGGDLGTESLRELHGVASNAAGRAGDEHLLAAQAYMSASAQSNRAILRGLHLDERPPHVLAITAPLPPAL
jgi:hypothetical protein